MECDVIVTLKTSSRRKGVAPKVVIGLPRTNTMCDEFPLDHSKFPAWDRDALIHLRSELHSSPREFLHLLDEEEHQPAFDPIQVRDLLRKEQAAGREPGQLVLGQLEMASFLHFVCRGFGEESGARMSELFFLGIPVVEDAAPSRLEFVVDDGFSTQGPGGQHAA